MDGMVDAVVIVGGFIVILLALRRVNKSSTAQPAHERAGDAPGDGRPRWPWNESFDDNA